MKFSDSSPNLGGGDFWPPGFRFHPTDEELVLYYLKRKICRKRLKLDIVGEIDVYKWDPEQLPGQSKLKSGDKQWFFFSPRDRKYPNGARSNRATRNGYWKATGKDRVIIYNTRRVGIKKTLVFYRGRAPTGVRTDWVMHEYILDEEELKRCQAAKDCYVLYKLYRKSGPGPKNGEQYGAPFNEEDWGDEECVNIGNGHVTLDTFVKQVEDVDSVDSTRADNRVQSPLNDLEEFLNRIADEPLHFQPFEVDCAHALHRVVGDEGIQSTMVDSYLREPNLSERSAVLHPNCQQCDVQQPEVTSAPKICGQQSHVAEEDFLEDFLEMDDLIVPEPAVQNTQNPLESLQLEQLDGLCDFDLYHDAAMFLREMVPVGQVSVSDPFLNNIENEIINPASHSYPNDLDNGMINPVSHLDMSNLENDLVNPFSHLHSNNLNNDMVNHSSVANGISIPLWTHDQRSHVFTPAEPDWRTIPQSISGVVHVDNSANLTSGVNQNQNQNQNQDQSGKEDDGTESWFSSALWGFVDSIPTTPASASENALVNRAFERMSSFSRLKVSALNTNDSPGNPTATRRRSPGIYSRGLLCFSVLGLVCAILWVLIGTSVKVLGRFISS